MHNLARAVLFLTLIAGSRAEALPQKWKSILDRVSTGAVDPIRDADDVNIVQGGRILKSIKLPGQEGSGFSLNWTRKTKAGFEFSIEYGTRI